MAVTLKQRVAVVATEGLATFVANMTASTWDGSEDVRAELYEELQQLLDETCDDRLRVFVKHAIQTARGFHEQEAV